MIKQQLFANMSSQRFSNNAAQLITSLPKKFRDLNIIIIQAKNALDKFLKQISVQPWLPWYAQFTPVTKKWITLVYQLKYCTLS